jgi:hypothetical protein
MPRKLKDLHVFSVALVDSPAINKEFLLIKRQEGGDNMAEEKLKEQVEEKKIEEKVDSAASESVQKDAEVKADSQTVKSEEQKVEEHPESSGSGVESQKPEEAFGLLEEIMNAQKSLKDKILAALDKLIDKAEGALKDALKQLKTLVQEYIEKYPYPYPYKYPEPEEKLKELESKVSSLQDDVSKKIDDLKKDYEAKLQGITKLIENCVDKDLLSKAFLNFKNEVEKFVQENIPIRKGMASKRVDEILNSDKDASTKLRELLRTIVNE